MIVHWLAIAAKIVGAWGMGTAVLWAGYERERAKRAR
jgi:hypothetical protein